MRASLTEETCSGAELGFCNLGEKVVLSEDKEKQVTEAEHNKMVNAIRDGKTLVIDNINLKRKYRDVYHRLFKEYNITWDYIYVQALNLDVNVERRSDAHMDKKVFENIVKSFEL